MWNCFQITWLQLVFFFPNVDCKGGTCDSGEPHENNVILYAKIEGRKEHIMLDTLTYAAYKVSIFKDDI